MRLADLMSRTRSCQLCEDGEDYCVTCTVYAELLRELAQINQEDDEDE